MGSGLMCSQHQSYEMETTMVFTFLQHYMDSTISNLKLQKLMYYAQGFHLALFDAPLFDDTLEAWLHGPVVPSVYHAFKKHEKAPIPCTDESACMRLESDEFDLVREVFDVFGRYSAWSLREMTHAEPPWMNHEKSAGTIPSEELKTYFKTRLEG